MANGYGLAGAAAQVVASAPHPMGTLPGIMDASQTLNQRLGGLLETAARLADTLKGSQPTQGQSAEKEAVPGGALDVLDRNQRRSFDIVNALEEQLARIASAVGA